MDAKYNSLTEALLTATDLARSARFDEALATLDPVDPSGPVSDGYWALYMACLGQLGRFRELEAMARKLHEASELPSVVVYRALILAAAGQERAEEAIEWLREASACWPEDPFFIQLWARHR